MSEGLTDARFIVGFQTASHWNWKVAFYLYGAGTSAGLISLEMVLRALGVIDERTALCGMWAGLALALAALALLFDHLGPGARWRFLYVFRRPASSWIARGAIIVTVLIFLRMMVLLPSLPGFAGLPWGEGSVGGEFLQAGVLLFAVAFMAYSGLVLSSWNSIAFWNTPLLPLLYICYSLLGGMAALPVLAFIVGDAAWLGRVGPLFLPALLILLGVAGFVLLLYLWGMSSASLPARESVRRLVRGERRSSFWLGVVGVGLIIPAGLAALMLSGEPAPGPLLTALLAAAFLGVQVGGFLLRDNVLRVGVYGYPL